MYKPMVLEITFGEVKCRPYCERILCSKAEQIVIKPVSNRQDETAAQRLDNSKFVSSIMESYQNKNLIEMSFKGLLSVVGDKLWRINSSNNNNNDDDDNADNNKSSAPQYSPAAYLTAQVIARLNTAGVNKKRIETKQSNCDGDGNYSDIM